ncbi:YdaU family protein [Paracoccus sp. R86501]|uniref:YdaU family protein n=1 Tax=Paracoccus sp. R86501 TaxID=3101711 RepID=UPI0036712080
MTSSQDDSKAVHVAFYASDWLAGTRGYTPAQTGVYITMLAMMYEHTKPLPYDDARLARLCNCPAGTFKKILAVLIEDGKIVRLDAGLWNKRAGRELEAAKGAMDRASGKGKKAINARWSKAKGESDHAQKQSVTLRSDEQLNQNQKDEKTNKFNESWIHEYYPSNTNQNQNQNQSKEEEEDTRARKSPDPKRSLIGQITHALGFDHLGIVPRYWMASDAPVIVQRWVTDLGLTADEVLTVATQNMRAHGSPANGPKTLTRHMQDYAAAKHAPKLEPTPQKDHSTVTVFKPSYQDRRAAAADDALRERIEGAIRNRSPSRGGISFD